MQAISTSILARTGAIGFALILGGIPLQAQAQDFKRADVCPAMAVGLPDTGTSWVVFFESSKTAVRSDSTDRLDLAARSIKGRMAQIVCLRGQADKEGNADSNRQLALARAEQTGRDLVARGVDPSALLVITDTQVGETLPLLSSMLDRQEEDRRVTISIVK
jgi:outer membrane protein OmpA-like peptidoglycan-associated protein